MDGIQSGTDTDGFTRRLQRSETLRERIGGNDTAIAVVHEFMETYNERCVALNDLTASF